MPPNHKIRSLSELVLLTFAIFCTVSATSDKCESLIENSEAGDQGLLAELRVREGIDENSQEIACLGHIVENNYFASADYLINKAFKEQTQDNKKQLEQAQGLVLSAIQRVRSGHDSILEVFEKTQMLTSYTQNIPEISPSVKWHQSENNVNLEVKFATRIDSPACMDLYDQKIELIALETKTNLLIQAFCRNDKRILKYFLNATLFGEVEPFSSGDQSTTTDKNSETPSDPDDIFDQLPQASKVGGWSAGRVQIELAKTDGASTKWKTLFASPDSLKYQKNVGKWWDRIEKASGDDNSDDSFDIDSDEPETK